MIYISKLGKLSRALGKKGINKKGQETMLGGAIRRVKKGEESSFFQKIPGLNWELNPALAWGVVGVSAATGFGSSVAKAGNSTQLGDISAGELSKMTSSIQHSPLVTASQEGTYNTEKMSHSWANYGVEADIVFAMHNMR